VNVETHNIPQYNSFQLIQVNQHQLKTVFALCNTWYVSVHYTALCCCICVKSI